MERYRVVNGSESGSKVLTHTVYDSHTPLEKQGYFKTVCECSDAEIAEDIAIALNEKGW